MRRMSVMLSLVVLCATGIAGPQAAESPKPANQPYWKIAGHLEEACKCKPACPCWFNSKPTYMNCGGQLVHFITKGSYGDIPLDGLAYARMGQSPDGEAMMDAYGNWVFDYLYIDERANTEQRQALEDIAWTIQPKASSNVQVRYVPITRQIEGNEHRVAIGQHGSFAGHLMDSLLGGAPRIMHAPGADPMRAEFRQGQTTAFRYTDASQDWNSNQSNYMYTEFEVDSEQYAVFNAKVKQMMEAKQQAGGAEPDHQHH
ncbi:MAG TPA: DUF1326 domain-containing protein [Acidobacteriota bacterium]